MHRKPMSMQDRVFLSFDTDRVFTHITLVLTFHTPAGAPGFVADLVHRLRATPVVTEPFNFRIPGRWPRRNWEVLNGSDIDMRHHVVHTALPAPGDTRQLEAAVAGLHSRPLDATKPLWESHIIEGLADSRFAICFKVHHALMDGTVLVDLLSRMTSIELDDHELRAPWTLPLPPKGASPVVRRFETARDLAAGGWRFVREARRRADPALAIPLGGPRSRVLNGRLGRQRSWVTREFTAEQIDALTQATGASLNEILLTALSGALRRYLTERGELPARSLVAGVPVASRSGFADPRHNAGAMILVNLFTDRPDPCDRFRGVVQSSALAKEHLSAMSPGAADRYAVLTFGPFMLQEVTRLSGRIKAPFNVTLSNVTGLNQQRYLLQAAQDGLFAAANLGHGQRLNVSVMTVCGRVCVGFTGCGDALGDISILAEHLGDAVTELQDALTAT